MFSGSEYLTSNTAIAYPFKENASGLVYNGTASYGSGAKVVLDFIIDASIRLPLQHTECYLHSVTGVDGDYRIRFSNQDGTIIMNEILILPSLINGYAVLSFTDSVDSIHIRLLVGDSFITYITGLSGTTLFSAGLQFEDDVITYSPTKVQQFELDGQVISGSIKLSGSYNTEIEVEGADPGVDISECTINVAPGIGDGLYPITDTVQKGPALGLIPDKYGNIDIEGDDCTVVVPHKSTGIIELQSECVQCCTCDDYLDSALFAKQFVDRTYALKNDLEALHAELNSAIASYNDSLIDGSPIIYGLPQASPGCPHLPNMVGCGKTNVVFQILTFLIPPFIDKLQNFTYKSVNITAIEGTGGATWDIKHTDFKPITYTKDNIPEITVPWRGGEIVYSDQLRAGTWNIVINRDWQPYNQLKIWWEVEYNWNGDDYTWANGDEFQG